MLDGIERRKIRALSGFNAGHRIGRDLRQARQLSNADPQRGTSHTDLRRRNHELCTPCRYAPRVVLGYILGTKNLQTGNIMGTQDRRTYLGGSDARTILGSDENALIRLWQEKRGEIEPEDLSTRSTRTVRLRDGGA